MFSYQFLTIYFKGFGIESCNFLHQGKLNQDKSTTEYIWFIDVMFSKARVSINNMGFPEDGG